MTPSDAVAHGARDLDAGIVKNLLLERAHVLDGVGRGVVAPRGLGLGLVSGGNAVVEREGLTVSGHRDNARGERHHAHTLSRGGGTAQKIHLVIEDAVHDGINVGLITGLKDKVKLLPKLLVNVGALLEVRHLGGKLLEADAGTRHGKGVERGRLQHDRETTGTLNPLKGKAALLVVGEKLLARVRGLVLRKLLPVGGKLRRLHNIKDRHSLYLLINLSLPARKGPSP